MKRLMKNTVVVLASMMAVGLVGCSSYGSFGSYSYKKSAYSNTAAVRNQNIETSTRVILTGTTAAANRALIGEQAKARFRGIVSGQDQASVSIDFQIEPNSESPVLLHPPGGYRAVDVMNGNARLTAAFVNWVRLTLNALQQEVAKGATISATYYGGADGLPVRALKYRGEYGLVNVVAIHNGVNYQYHIASGQRINNAELALLRAVSLRHYLRANSKVEIKDRGFEIETSTQVGGAARYVRVTIHLNR